MKPRHVITLNGEYWVLERVLRCSNRECPGYSTSFETRGMERDYKALEAEMKKKKSRIAGKRDREEVKRGGRDGLRSAVVESEVEGVQSKMEVVGGELQKKEKFEKCWLIIHILVLLLKITVDNFPFALYYLDLYDRYRKIRRTVRHCLAVYPHDDAYRDSLLELNRVLTAVIEDKRIKSLVKVLKADYKIFKKWLREECGERKEVRFAGIANKEILERAVSHVRPRIRG